MYVVLPCSPTVGSSYAMGEATQDRKEKQKEAEIFPGVDPLTAESALTSSATFEG